MNFRTPYNYKKASPNFFVFDDEICEVLEFDTSIEPNKVNSAELKGNYTNSANPLSPFPRSAVSLSLSPFEAKDFYNQVSQVDTNVQQTNIDDK